MNASASPEFDASESAPVSFAKPLLLSLSVSAVLAGASLYVTSLLAPNARVPIHWNIHGQVDGYAGRAALFLFPGIIAVSSLVFFAVPKLEPRRAHLHRSASAYRWFWFMMIGFLTELQVLILLAAVGHPVAIDRWAIGGVGLMLLVSGNFFGKIRSNYMFGVRTPWTLSSELAWNQTHRLTGRLFVLGGLILLIATVAGIHGLPLFATLMGWVFATLAISTTYSYFVWRRDPDRHDAVPLFGTKSEDGH